MQDEQAVINGVAEAAGRGIQDEVKIVLEKQAGVGVFRRSIEASSAAAALNGVAVMIVELAKLIGSPVESVLALLTALLLAPAVGQVSECGNEGLPSSAPYGGTFPQGKASNENSGGEMRE